MSSEDWLLNESHRPQHGNPNDDDDGDGNSVDSGRSSPDGPSPEHLEMKLPNPPRSLTYINGLAITISLQIGAGIFSAPAAVRTNVSTSTAALLVWVLAGLLVWTGAASFIELGTRITYNGGMQEYLRHCYGDVYGFLFAWAWILLSRPCAMAMVALVFSEYLFKTLSPDHDVDVWVLKGMALLAITGVTILNFIGTNVGASTANFFLVLKVFALSTVAVAGVVFAVSDFAQARAVFPPATPDPGDSSLWADVGGFADAILASLFAYGGCDSVSAKLRAFIRERSGLTLQLAARLHCWRDERPTSHTTTSHP
jgi:L-type amino acid transporter 6